MLASRSLDEGWGQGVGARGMGQGARSKEQGD
jgi:hypothetical protein